MEMKMNQKKLRCLPVSKEPGSEGERIVRDFLEIGCVLDQDKIDFLIRELNLHCQSVESIELLPCFTVRERLVCIVESTRVDECWLYYPELRRVMKRYFRP